MAETEYRVLKRVDPEGDLSELPEGTVVYALLPDTFTGNVKRAAYDAHGEGDYAKVAGSSWSEFPARRKEVVSFS